MLQQDLKWDGLIGQENAFNYTQQLRFLPHLHHQHQTHLISVVHGASILAQAGAIQVFKTYQMLAVIQMKSWLRDITGIKDSKQTMPIIELLLNSVRTQSKMINAHKLVSIVQLKQVQDILKKYQVLMEQINISSMEILVVLSYLPKIIQEQIQVQRQIWKWLGMIRLQIVFNSITWLQKQQYLHDFEQCYTKRLKT